MSSDPFGGIRGPRSEPQGGVPTEPDGSIVRGTGLRPLPNERIVRSMKRGGFESNLQGEGLDLFLTDRRLIQKGTDRVLLIFKSGRKVRSAYLEDIDSAGVRTKRLSQWLLAVGVLFLLFGMIGLVAEGQDDDYSDENTASDYSGGLLLAGGAAVALWIFIKREQVVFSVAGTDQFEYDVLKGPSGTDRAGEFLSEFFSLRPEFKTPASPKR